MQIQFNERNTVPLIEVLLGLTAKPTLRCMPSLGSVFPLLETILGNVRLWSLCEQLQNGLHRQIQACAFIVSVEVMKSKLLIETPHAIVECIHHHSVGR